MSFPRITLAKGKDKAFNRKHPWIFSGALQSNTDDIAQGAWVEVENARKEPLGMAHFHKGSIALRVFDFEGFSTPAKIYSKALQKAWDYRMAMGYPNEKTNAFRWVFGESDGLPGLIADYYNGYVILQAHTVGVYRDLATIAKLMAEIAPDHIKGIYNKTEEDIDKGEDNLPEVPRWLHGKTQKIEISENGVRIVIDFAEGQKTGFFLDQRDAREWVGQHSKGKKVLNAFSYTGGFSLLALANGADKVVSLDVSQRAIDVANQNAQLNQVEGRHQGVTQDIFDYLRTMPNDFDLVVLDPPAFAKRRNAVHNAVQAYKRLNAAVLKKVPSGTLICTFSCSQNVSRQLFEDTLRAAAIESKRTVRIVHRFDQPTDHPVSIYFPEGEYLKGVAMYVD
ncbi:MAG: class I SAM-dependent rRNA methyltransferase [Schleiferiaceae bacterium]